ncbi:MAG: hypothetical protein LBC98_07620 [Prevotellaceae bacterium]|jgi:hypothetical protein|nr:hypothetical protein [Prevotellaceae bacterium]
MKSKFLKIASLIACVALVASSCGNSKKASSGYAAVQTKPANEEQKQAANRGLKLQKEECEELALEQVTNLREAGNGISPKESLAINIALLDARAKLAQQLEVLINGMVRNFDQQHESSASKAINQVGKASNLQQGYFEQFLTNTRPICKNTYVKDNGNYNVYVCIELGEQQQRAIHKKLTQDEKISIDFEESQFLKELNKAKEDYRQQQSK